MFSACSKKINVHDPGCDGGNASRKKRNSTSSHVLDSRALNNAAGVVQVLNIETKTNGQFGQGPRIKGLSII